DRGPADVRSSGAPRRHAARSAAAGAAAAPGPGAGLPGAGPDGRGSREGPAGGPRERGTALDGCLIMADAAPRCSNPDCGELGAVGDRFCEACGHELGTPPGAAPELPWQGNGLHPADPRVERWLQG